LQLNCAFLDSVRHIAIFASWYPAKAHSLNGNFIRDFAHLLSERYKVSVIYVGADPEATAPVLHIRKSGNCTEYLAGIPHKRGLIGFIRHQWAWYVQIKQFWKTMLAQEGKPDLIQAQVIWKMGLAAAWYSWRAKIPFIVHEHWTGYYPADPQLKGLRMLWHRLILRRAKGVSAVSKPLALALEELGARTPVKVLINTVEAGETKAERSVTPHFLHVSNFREEQKQSRSVAMVFRKIREEFPQARMTMAGAVPDDFKAAFSEIEGLEFSGICTRSEMDALYRGATAVVSFSRFETFALSIAEGLLQGTPAIYTACGGPETYMQPHWGLRADADDPDTLYQCMRVFCVGSREWNYEQIALEARECFSRKSLLDSFDQWIKSLN
jgi:glycosyltransferase involved in cell wall biosynthesis